MAKHLSQEEVRGIAEYARIGLTDDELAQMTQDLNGMLDSLDTIFEYDLEGVEPTSHPIGSLSNVMRKDVQQESFSQVVALENAPAAQDGCFLIPSILGCGEDGDAGDGAADDDAAGDDAVGDDATGDGAADAVNNDGAASSEGDEA